MPRLHNGEHKIRLSIGFTPRQDAAIMAEAKRLGSAAGDVVRRVVDNWIDARERNRPPEKVLVLDRETQSLRQAR